MSIEREVLPLFDCNGRVVGQTTGNVVIPRKPLSDMVLDLKGTLNPSGVIYFTNKSPDEGIITKANNAILGEGVIKLNQKDYKYLKRAGYTLISLSNEEYLIHKQGVL